MKKILLLVVVSIMTALSVVAQVTVTNTTELVEAIQSWEDDARIQLGTNIDLTTRVTIPENAKLEINLNGFNLNRGLTESASDGQVIYVKKNAELTISGIGSAIQGGYGENGGAILNEGTLIIYNIVISGNKAASQGGGIYNSQGAECTLNAISMLNNTTSGKGGAIANYGTMTLLGGAIKDNTSADHGGGVFVAKNALFSMNGGEIKNNTSSQKYTSGIYVEGTLEMEGNVDVTENLMGNVVLPGFSFIQVTGAFEETAKIGVTCETSGVITQGFTTYNPNLDYNDIFLSDMEGSTLSFDGGEVALSNSSSGNVEFYYAQWDEETKNVKYTKKYYSGGRELTNQSSLSGWYVVSKNYTNKTSRVTINEDTHIVLMDGMTLTLEKGIYIKDGKTLSIYAQAEGTGHLNCTGGESDNAAIGGNKDKVGGYLIIHGGEVTATANHNNAAGIGGGNHQSGIRGVTIYGGTVTAKGKDSGAGIGKGQQNNVWEEIRIYGGDITAIGGINAAGIGGGEDRGNGSIWIYGGNIYARTTTNKNNWNGTEGAGIGGGHGGDQDRPINIYGGTIEAIGYGGAGIGGGYKGNGGEINIYGGNVTAKGLEGKGAGIGGGYKGKGGKVYISDDATVYARSFYYNTDAIGHGQDNKDSGTLTLGNQLKVTIHYTNSKETVLNSQRLKTCKSDHNVDIERCDHASGLTYTADETTHTSHCKYCLFSETEEHQFVEPSMQCGVCGLINGEDLCTVGVATVRDANVGYEMVGYQVVKNTPFNLPECNYTPEGYKFVGWLDYAQYPVDLSSFVHDPSAAVMLLPAGSSCVPTENMMLYARYEQLNVTLVDNEDNSETIAAYQDMLAHSVTLQGRTLYRDGTWNTLCLPFNVDNLNGTPLEGATVKMLESTAYDASTTTLTLTFSDKLQSLSAGMPYIVKWDGESDNISNPTFNNVTLSNYTDGVETDEVIFCGTYSPITLAADDKTKLYLGAGNKLYYPNGEMNINACRAYFQLNGLTAGEPTSLTKISNFVVNFGVGESTGIDTIPSTSTQGGDSRYWYDLQGRKLNGKPATKGMYINNGRKVVIK